MLLLLLGGVAIAVAIFLCLEAMTVRQRQLALSMRRAKRYGGFTLREVELGKGMGDRMLSPAIERLAGFALRLPGAISPDELRRRLIAAGLANTINPSTFLAGKTVFAIGSVGVGVLLMLGGNSMGLLIGLGGAWAGFMLPDTFLTMRTRKRREDIRIAMPDILDLLCVSVEAGLGFDAAMAKVAERMEGPLVEEVRIVLHEMRIGESRSKALKSMAERVDLPETTSFVRSIVQADQLGISLGRILRVQAQDMRNRRQMAAEEKAMKAPVKMLFPTVLFIFPAMFIVVLGPAMMQIGKVFGGG